MKMTFNIKVRPKKIGLLAAVCALLVACGNEAGSSSEQPASTAGDAATSFDSGREIRVAVPGDRDKRRAFVNLASATTIAAPADPMASPAWDLAFEGLDVFTNGGSSGKGAGAAFGPLDAVTFVGDVAPTTPFLQSDKPGGAFLEWYDYEDATHALWSRYHVFGVRDGARTWKVQILGYYGERAGAAVSALYSLRYAEVLDDGTSGPTIELTAVDGTSGGTAGTPASGSECLDLASGARTMLAQDAAATSTAWHLCFRRSAIVVNGEQGGPRGVTAVDLEAAATRTETIDQVKLRTAESEKAKFDAVSNSSFEGKPFRGDRIVSVFSEAWIDPAKPVLAPTYGAWLVVGADGRQKFLVAFVAFESPTATALGTVVMRVKPVR